MAQPSKGGCSFSIISNFRGNPYFHKHGKSSDLKVKDYLNLSENRKEYLEKDKILNYNHMEGMINIDNNPNFKKLVSENNVIPKANTERIQNGQNSREENSESNDDERFQSENKRHICFHKDHPMKITYKSRSLLAPIFNKSTNEVINEWYKSESGKMRSSYRETYYKKQQEKFLERAKNLKFEDGQTNMLLISPPTPKMPLKHLAYNFIEDDPLAKYNLRGLMTEHLKPQNFKIQEKKLVSHDSDCLDCNRFQIKVKHLENQLGDYRKLQKQSLQLKAEQSEKKRLADYVTLLEIKRNPINKLNAKINHLEQKNLKISEYNNVIAALECELEKTRECNQWFHERIKSLENQLQASQNDGKFGFHAR